ncbi:MAG: lectin-like protein [Microcystis sp. LE19-84.1B]|uniref:beta strand repeat-containing protein n=1 Tax=Microcystis sp. LE19-84.1B TaxID=3016438 RepID=UPI0022C39159|nr:Calx-beta domain-containing protein [Microcystis sp. LE19-84.1B]MCZ8222405.1 lectin-like protein [Microcystis sp. LE19-84.1B]
MNSTLLPILPAVYDILFDFAQSDGFWANLETAFGTSYDVVKATQLRQQWQSRDFSQLPPITVQNLGNSGIFGAYSSSTNRIYISQALIDSGDATTLKAVLLEEIGHFIDAQINSSDTPGDEGQLFSALVRGEVLTGEQIAAIQGENDAATITVDGQAVSVEMAVKYLTSGITVEYQGQKYYGWITYDNSVLKRQGQEWLSGDKVQDFGFNFLGKTYYRQDFYWDEKGVSLGFVDGNPVAALFAFNTPDGRNFGFGQESTSNISWPNGFLQWDYPNARWIENVGKIDFSYPANNDDSATISINDVTVTEGNSGTTNAVFTVTLSNPVDTAITLNYATADGTATTADNDYTAITTTPLTFNPGETSKTITVAVNGDTKVETNENFFVNLSNLQANGRNVTLTDNQGQGTINNDDSASIAITDVTITEGNSGTTNAVFTVTLSNQVDTAVTVNYATANGTATTADNDYTAIPTTALTFNAGETSKTITVAVNGDTKVESNETFFVNLSDLQANGRNVTLTDNQGQGTINNDDSANIVGTVQWKSEEGGNSHYYKVIYQPNGISWNTAKAQAEALGGYLVTITSAEENNFVSSLFSGNSSAWKNLGIDTRGPWIGGFQPPNSPEPNGGWQWVSGEPFNYTNWGVSANGDQQPLDNNDFGEDYIHFFGGGNNNFTAKTWNDLNDDTSSIGGNPIAYIIEIELDSLISINDVTVTEGNSGTTNAVFTVTLSNAVDTAVTVNYATADGTATTADNDYTAIAATPLTFNPGETSKTITVAVNGDTKVESNETFFVNLSNLQTNGRNVTITDNQGQGTITDDDVILPSITLAVAPSSVTEDGTSNLIYTFTRSGVTTNLLTVNYSIGGTANNGTDYASIPTGVTFAANLATATVTINPTADTTVESDETVALTLTAGTDYTIGTTTAVTGTITNDDTSVTLAVSPASVTEDGTSNLVYTFTRSGVTSNALTVNYTLGGTATLNTDYTRSGTNNTVTFVANATTATVIVDPTADTTVESNETVALTLASGTGYTIGTPNAATGTITNDDTSVTLAVSPASVTENGTTNLIYTFTRTGVTTSALTANYTVGGTATFNTDYTQTGAASFTSTTGTVTFAANATKATVTVDPTADTTVESDETVVLTLATGTGYTIGTPTAVTGTIANDDTNVTLAVSSGSVTEDGTNNLVYTFTRTGVTTNALTVNYTLGGTATLNTDYTRTGTNNTVTFAANATTATVTVDPTADTTVESDETVALTLTTGTGYTIGTTTAVIGTITNDDFSQLSINDIITVVEGKNSNAVLTVTVNNPNPQQISVNYATAPIDATANVDYTSQTGTLIIPANASTATITIPILNDDLNEPDEVFAVTLSNATNAIINPDEETAGVIITDTWQSILTRTLPNGVENLKLIGTNNINGTGNNANNIITGNSGNNQINGANGADILTGGLGADTFIFQFGQSTISASDRITDFAINSDKIDLLTQGGTAMNAPSSFSRATDSTTTTLDNLINQVFTDANGAITGNQGLGVNSAALVQVTTGAIAGTYLVINDSTAGFQSSNDLLINITGFTGTLPALGNIPVSNFFV